MDIVTASEGHPGDGDAIYVANITNITQVEAV